MRSLQVIEVFVIIAVIAILGCLLIPAISEAKKMNQKQKVNAEYWETVTPGTQRKHIGTGWLIRNTRNGNLIFVPDRKQEWKLEVESESR